MNISNSQVNRLRHFVRAGLRSLFRPEPQTAVEWADANYYLPKESAYQEGRWETLPFQRAIMNAMGSDYIREVNVVKSARVGYSKMLLGVYAYFIEHNRREADEEPEDDVLMQKAAGLAGGVRFGPDGNEVIPASPDVADMTEDDVMLMTVSEGIAGGVRYG